MESTEQETLRIGQLVDAKTAHIVRSHRAPINHRGRRWFAGIMVVVFSFTTLTGVPTTSPARGQTANASIINPTVMLPADDDALVGGTVTNPGHPTDGSTQHVAAPAASRGTPRSTPAPRPTSRIEVVIAFALAQRGKPYRLRQAGPYAYDCSGLVMAAFARVGIKLPHYTGSIIAYGKHISRANMRRGDIVFLSSHHVAIYLGNNKMIVAPHTGTVVKIQTVYAFYAARRIIG